MRAANNEGVGHWSEPSEPARTLTHRPNAPRAPAVAVARPPPGPLSLWLSIFLPDEDGGDPVTAMLLETRRHGGTQPPEWSRCERHPVPPTLTASAADGAASNGPTNVTASSGGSGTGGSGGGRASEHRGRRRVGGGGGAGAGSVSSSRTGTACCEIVVLVDGLTPRTYYSFRASAVNARGGGDPGPPCRRVRTAAPRPPSWGLEHNALNPTLQETPPSGGETEQAFGDEKATERAGGAGRVVTDGTHLSCAPPRAACSGLGACTVLWEPPFSNGAVVELYEVEVVRIGPEVVRVGVGETAKDKEGEEVHGGDVNGSSGHDSHPAEAAAVKVLDEKQVELNEGTEGRVVDGGGEEYRLGDLGTLSLSVLKERQKEEAAGEAAATEPPPPPPEVVCLPAPEDSARARGREGGGGEAGKAEVVREVEQRLTRSVPSHMRYLVVRGLATGGDYIFRVRASNVAGMGEAGPWTEVVRVVDPADEDSS